MSGIGAFSLSVLMIAVFALIGGGLYLLVARGDRRKGLLMLVAAAVALGNVLVWSL